MSDIDLTGEKQIAYGTRIKSLGNGRVAGRLVYFTGPTRRDLSGEYFDATTDFGETPKAGTITLYHHALDMKLGAAILGHVDTVKFDDEGIWIEAQLDLNHKYARRVQQLVERGALSWSSGALPQTARVDTNGHIRTWHIFEASLTPTPAEPFGTRIQSIKSLGPVESLESLIAKEGLDEDSERTDPSAAKSESIVKEAAMAAIKNTTAIIEAVMAEVGELSAEQVERLTAAIEAANAPDVEAVNAAPADELVLEEMYDEAKATEVQKSAVRIAQSARKYAELELKKLAAAKFAPYANAAATDPYTGGTKARTQNGDTMNMNKAAPWGSNQPAPRSQISVSEARKYQGLSHADMIFGAQLLNARHNPSDRPGVTMGDIGLSDEYLRVMANKTQKAADAADAKGNDFMKSALPWKSDELNQTDVAAQGLEWLGTLQGNDYWETPRARRLWDTLAAAGMRVRELPQGYSAYNMDKEGSDPIVYSPPEASDLNGTTFEPEVTVKQSPFGTGDVTVTPGKMGARVIVTQELIEDSLVPILAGTRQKMMNTLLDHRDKVLFNGDTTATANTNINLIDGTPGTGSSRPYYMATNGIRKNALITNTAQKVDASGANNLSLWRLARSKVNAIYRENPENLIYLTNTLTHDSTLAYPELATWDVAQMYATITAGVVERLFKIPVYGTVHIPLANSSGVVPAAGGTLGTIICLYPNAMVAVIKREITLKTFEYIRSDATEFVATTRLGIGFMVTDALGLVYNVSNATGVL